MYICIYVYMYICIRNMATLRYSQNNMYKLNR